jgi:molybdenum cofactor synthesis domain-containing protein
MTAAPQTKPKRTVRTAAALLIGNELLSGKTQEQNLIELARTLRALGIRLERVSMLGDERAALAAEVRSLSAQHEVVFTSGGVGPTHDDVTVEAVADAFGVECVTHPALAELLQQVYGERFADSQSRMALVPRGAELMGSSEVRWPTTVMNNVWLMPGVPELFRMKLVIVREHLAGPGPIFSRALYTWLEEPELKPLLDQTVARHHTIEIGSYPQWFDRDYKTKLTFDGSDAAEVALAVDDLLRVLPAGAVVRHD